MESELIKQDIDSVVKSWGPGPEDTQDPVYDKKSQPQEGFSFLKTDKDFCIFAVVKDLFTGRSKITPDLIKSWISSLNCLNIQQIKYAHERAKVEYEGDNFPISKQKFIEKARTPIGQNYETQAREAWRLLIKAIHNAGYYDSVYFEDECIAEWVREYGGGWITFSLSDQDQMNYVKHDFIKEYQALKNPVGSKNFNHVVEGSHARDPRCRKNNLYIAGKFRQFPDDARLVEHKRAIELEYRDNQKRGEQLLEGLGNLLADPTAPKKGLDPKSFFNEFKAKFPKNDSLQIEDKKVDEIISPTQEDRDAYQERVRKSKRKLLVQGITLLHDSKQ